EISRHLPPAVRCARASAHGPVNDVAFSPHLPLIAVGTAAQRLVLWNFQRGERVRLLTGFERSIGRVAFTQTDLLLCAEGRQSGKRSRLHAWNEREHTIEEYDDMLTDLVPAGEHQMLLTCRDGRVMLWDAHCRCTDGQRQFPFWARAARVAPGADRALLLHEGASLVALPRFEVLASKERRLRGSVSICAAFAPGGKEFVVGHHNGDVLVCWPKGREIRVDRHVLVRYPKPVRGAELLEQSGIVVTAGADGTVDFTSWSNRCLVGRLTVEGRRLTSFHVSPTGDFLAIGDSDASMSLWDLRAMHVPMLFSMAFARARHSTWPRCAR
ncbi:MAG: WD40 repeat domain-containing protein, partial [Thermoguttaceae bacterium]|nr:WD40 repeat domain-containing protein [Thermoguttaceae bacterium]